MAKETIKEGMKIIDGHFVIVMKIGPCNKASLSKSGKSYTVCSTRGRESIVNDKGQTVYANVNVYIPKSDVTTNE